MLIHSLFIGKEEQTIATTRLIPMHMKKGATLLSSIRMKTEYALNPDKTNNKELVSSYECDKDMIDHEFLLTKREYYYKTGRTQERDVIAYQIRQAFKPGEITPEKANELGYDLAMRFTKGKYAFIVCTHTDRAHIHNHIIFNSTALDATRKFKNYWLSSFILQRVSDLICLENGLSVIEPKPYRNRIKYDNYPRRETMRSIICKDIDDCFNNGTKDMDQFVKQLNQKGYEVKKGKYLSVKNDKKKFIRLDSLPEGYREEDIRNRFHQKSGKQEHVNLLIDIQSKMQNKGPGYERWATNYNIKQMAKTLLYLRENDITELEDLNKLTERSVDQFNLLSGEMISKDNEIKECIETKKQILNYIKTRDIYVQYRKAGYNKKFYDANVEEIILHKAAKKYFDEMKIKKLPKVKELNERFTKLLKEKRTISKKYYKERARMQKLLKAQKNVYDYLNTGKDAKKIEIEKGEIN